MVKKVVMSLDLAEVFGPDCIPVVVMKNVNLNFYKYLLNSSIYVCRSLAFQIVRRFHWWSMYLGILGKGLQLNTTALLVFFL